MSAEVKATHSPFTSHAEWLAIFAIVQLIKSVSVATSAVAVLRHSPTMIDTDRAIASTEYEKHNIEFPAQFVKHIFQLNITPITATIIIIIIIKFI